MSQPARAEGRNPQELFAEFLERVEAEPALTFERWVQDHITHAAELRGLYDAYVRMQPHFPEGEAVRDESSVSVSLERGYEILEELGRGGYGRVYRARDRVLDREVALKVLREATRVAPTARRRFLEEARVLARLDHANIVRIHSIESEGDEIRLCLELVEGRTLQAIVEEDGPLSAEEAARVGIDLCRALAAIHAQGLVHMDVKPGNVMRASGGRIVLLDFGFARATVESGQSGGSPLGGTPPYMSPEQFEGRTDIGARSDVYSLGVVIYWLVAGRYPYQFTSNVDLARKVMMGHVTPLLDVRSDVPAALVEIIERAMARKEAERFPSAGAMEEALRGFLGGQSRHERSLPPASHARRTVLLAVGAVLLLGALWIVPKALAKPSFDIDYAFYKDVDGESVHLASGDSVRLGDKLHLEARSDEAFYLYVFNQDEKGTWSRLLPSENEASLHDKDVLHRFPPTGSWEVDIAGEQEHLYVVASPRRVPFADELVSTIPVRGIDQGTIASAHQERLRGIAGVPKEEPARGPFDLKKYFSSFERNAGPDTLTAHHELRNVGG